MATWKKVIVSGSDGELNTLFTSNHITASGDISASGYLYGNLPTGTADEVVIYNTATGRLEFKVLDLVSAQRAPELFMIDHNKGSETTQFKLSFDSGSPTIPTNAPITPSASLDGGSSYSVVASGGPSYALNINSTWDDFELNNEKYFDPGDSTNKTGSRSEGFALGPDDTRIGLQTGTSRSDITIFLNRTNNSVSTAVPAYSPGPAYADSAFEVPAFGATDTASLQVYLNGMDTPQATFRLYPTQSGNPSITTEINNIIMNLSPSGSAVSTALDVDGNKSWRSGSLTIEQEAQQDGYNYCYLFYTASRGDTQIRALTNFVDWFYDNDGAGHAMGSTAIEDDNVSLTGVTADDTASISGIHYYNETAADSAIYRVFVSQSNQYRNIYPVDTGLTVTFNNTGTAGLTVTQSGAHLLTNPTETTEGATSGQTVNLAALADINEAHLSNTSVTCSFTLDWDEAEFHHPSTFLETGKPWGTLSNNLDLTAGVQFHHPNKTNQTRNAGTLDSWIMNDLDALDETNGNNLELFRSESYRLISRSYDSSETIDDAAYDWDGSKNIINGGGGHNSGSILYHSYMCYPTFAGETSTPGRFNSTYGPVQLNNYSAATGDREYFRYFKLISGQNGVKSFNLEFKGAGRIVHNTSTLFTNDDQYFKLEVMRTSGGAGTLLDSFIDPLDNDVRNGDSIEDSANSRYIPLTNTAGNINYSDVESVGGISVPRSVVKINDDANASSTSIGEFIVVRIIVPQGWTGYLDAMALTMGSAPTAILPTQSPF